MRTDMPKVLVERPRYGAASKYRERHQAFVRKSRSREDDVAQPQRMGMGFGGSKGLNENLQPLLRFLLARRGRKWDEVYSELRAHLAPQRAIDMHVMQHLWDFVLFARREHTGALVLIDDCGRARCELRADGLLIGHRSYRATFYVCAETRRLLYVRRAKSAPLTRD